MPRNIHRGSKHFSRKTSQLPSSGKAFLIVTEGEKTEPNYFRALCDRLQLNSADVEIVHPPATDPISLTKHAIELQAERKRRSKKEDYVVRYNEVWVVFDLEGIHDERRELAARARKLPGAKGICFAESDPCFEYWLLLHETYTTAPFENSDAVVRELKKRWPGYAKGAMPAIEFIEKLPTAILNADRCNVHHKESGGDGNPSTKIGELALTLNNAQRSALRII